jgi:hypothetical protein
VLDCLAKDRGLRPESAEELARRLRECAVASDWSNADAADWWQREGEAPAPESNRTFDAVRRLELDSLTRCDLPARHRAA